MAFTTSSAQTISVFCAPRQPLTRYKDPNIGKVCRTNPRRQVWCYECGRRIWAKNAVIQCYYDGYYIFCSDKKNCVKKRKH